MESGLFDIRQKFKMDIGEIGVLLRGDTHLGGDFLPLCPEFSEGNSGRQIKCRAYPAKAGDSVPENTPNPFFG